MFYRNFSNMLKTRACLKLGSCSDSETRNKRVALKEKKELKCKTILIFQI